MRFGRNVRYGDMVRPVPELSVLFPVPPTLSYPHTHRFSVKSWINNPNSIKGLALRWNLRMKEMLKCRDSSADYLVHVVKGGETLHSISKQHGVSIAAIASINKDIIDLDLVYEGQLIRVPSIERWSKKVYLVQRHRDALSAMDELSKRVNFSMLVSNELPRAKTIGYFLVLVPLIAFCIRCINVAFCIKVAGYMTHQDVSQSKQPDHGSKSMRWKSALYDPKEPEIVDTELRSDSNGPGDQAHISCDESYESYGKLEHEYQTFLSDCGISNCGYWRGSSPD